MKKNYISLAKKSADIQINELKKVKKIFSNSFVKAIDLILNWSCLIIHYCLEYSHFHLFWF